MLKLTNKEVLALQEVGSEVGGLFDELALLRTRFVEEAAEIVGKINEAKEPAREIMDDAANSAEEYYDNKSERWQDGDRGSAYAEWKERLRELADALAEETQEPEVTEDFTPEWVDDFMDPDFAEFEYEG